MADLTAMLQAAAGAGGDYQISRSLRFNSADSAYLSRTPASAGDRKTWTWSGWVKRSALGTAQCVLDAGPGPNTFLVFGAGNTLTFADYTSGPTYNLELITTQVLRDVSAWYHIVIAVDTTQATSSNRVKIYLNGSQITAFTTETYPSQNFDTGWNDATAHRIGSYLAGTTYFNGYLADVNLIDGQALTPSSFGETNETTGVWSPIKFNGPWNVGTGVNGFYLNFSDNSGVTSTTLGKDQAGSNNWTPNNFSVTAGAGNDSLVDTPTPYGTDTGAGGQVRGNYATWNPLVKVVSQPTFSNGNLVSTTPADWSSAVGTIGLTSGKWYWEIVNGNSDAFVGIVGSNANLGADLPQNATGTILYYGNTGNKRIDSVDTAYGSAFSTQVIGVALDIDGGTVVFYRDNVSQGSISLSSSTLNGKTIFPLSGVISTTATANFGQRPFAYTAPSGFKALVTTNLPEPTVVQGNKYFDTKLWAGNSSTQSIALEFAPGWIWNKSTGDTAGHAWWDVLRGTGALISSQSTDAETTGYNAITSFGSNAISLGADNTGSLDGRTNETGRNYVGWVWKANGAGVSNTAGSITSTVSANTIAGISIVTYTGTGSLATVGHGLGVKPAFILTKSRSTTEGWGGYHKSLGASYGIFLESTDAAYAASNYWNNTEPTSSVFTVNVNRTNNGTMVAYCFAEVEGFSKFGSYTGNGSTDGPFVFLGFRPAVLVLKKSSGVDNWFIIDSTRDPYNYTIKRIAPNLSNAENGGEAEATYGIDFNSNGFKVRASHTSTNLSGATFIYAAFAENPFKYSLAR
jgi:hypothetical protein